MNRHSLSLTSKVKYRAHSIFENGTRALLFWLSIATLLFVVSVSLVLNSGFCNSADFESAGLVESFWLALNSAMDPGGVYEIGWAYRFVMLGVSIFGILIVGTLIGVLTAGIDAVVTELRKGRSVVDVADHTLILGWSSKIVDAVKELIIANESRKRPVVTVLADRDKSEMIDYFNDHIPDAKNTKIICRSGEPQDYAALALVRPNFARSIILFSDGTEFSDANILKRTLALSKGFSDGESIGPIIAEVDDSNNALAIAECSNVITIEPAQLITRMMVQAARRGGLIAVYDELLSFDGVEIYFYQDESVIGRRYDDLILCFGSASLIGIYTKAGATRLNPLDNPEIKDGDQLIIIAEDDSLIDLSKPVSLQPSDIAFDASNQESSKAEKIVIIGWHSWSQLFLQELVDFLAEGSVVNVFYDPKLVENPDVTIAERFTDLSINFTAIDTCSFKELEKIDLNDVSNVILFSYRDSLSPTFADNKSLLTLAHLRALIMSRCLEVKVTSELQLSENRLLAIGDARDDFIASENFVSKVLVQLSENPNLKPILDELLTSDGCEIHLRASQSYVSYATRFQYGNLVEVGRERQETVIGIVRTDEANAEYVVQMAIPKAKEIQLAANDWIIVIAED
jgi:hypothetical protein